VRERRKEPRKGSEIDPETACIQTVGAPASNTFKILSGSIALRCNSKVLRRNEIDKSKWMLELLISKWERWLLASSKVTQAIASDIKREDGR
jgi:hypothetical protein